MTARTPRLDLRAVTAIFVLSGAAGLIYEVVWSRQLVLVFGNTTQAISAILTGFFGGMALGSAAGGRLADRVARPLRLYGLLELVLVPLVLVTPLTFTLLHEAYRGAYPALEANPTALVLVRFGLSLAALAPATVFMGATLPTLTRHLSRGRTEGLSGAFGRLYAANTLGAIGGTLAAGFVLIELLGLSETLAVGAACSATAGLGGLWLDRRARTSAPAPAPALAPAPAPADPPADPPTPAPAPARGLALALAVAFLSGLTSLGYQVLWTRLVSSGTGSSTYVFTLILAVFLAGLAAGSAAWTRMGGRIPPLRVVAVGELAVAVFAVIGMAVVIDRHAIGFVSPTMTASAFLGAFVLPTVVMVLPPSIALGLILPASSGLVADADGHVGGRAGQLLAANTLGAIGGTFLVPFVVMPAIGSPAAVGALAGASALLAVVAAALEATWPVVPRRAVAAASAAVCVLVAAGLATGGLFQDPTVRNLLDKGGRVFARAEDEIAPVVAGEYAGSPQIWVNGSSMTVLTIDTKLMPILPIALRPQASSALVVAFGMGTAWRTALIAGLRADAVELVPSVPAMFPWFYPDAARFVHDPDGRIIVADGRNHVDLSTERYDMVIVDPPPPIETSGVSVISSVEFYRAARDRLLPGGVMVQWVPYQETVDEFRAHVRSFASVFAHVTIAFGPGQHGTYMLGSDEPLALDPANIAAALARPGVVADLGSVDDAPVHDAAGWAALIAGLPWISDADVTRFAGDGPLITDDRPLPEYFLLRHLFQAPSPPASEASLLATMPRTAAGPGPTDAARP